MPSLPLQLYCLFNNAAPLRNIPSFGLTLKGRMFWSKGSRVPPPKKHTQAWKEGVGTPPHVHSPRGSTQQPFVGLPRPRSSALCAPSQVPIHKCDGGSRGCGHLEARHPLSFQAFARTVSNSHGVTGAIDVTIRQFSNPAFSQLTPGHFRL